MNLVIKEIIKSLRENWQEWEYTLVEDLRYRELHKLVHKRSIIGVFTGRPTSRIYNGAGLCERSSFKCELGFFAKRRLTKAIEFCISKIIAKKLEPEKGEEVGPAIRHLDLED